MKCDTKCNGLTVCCISCCSCLQLAEMDKRQHAHNHDHNHDHDCGADCTNPDHHHDHDHSHDHKHDHAHADGSSCGPECDHPEHDHDHNHDHSHSHSHAAAAPVVLHDDKVTSLSFSVEGEMDLDKVRGGGGRELSVVGGGAG